MYWAPEEMKHLNKDEAYVGKARQESRSKAVVVNNKKKHKEDVLLIGAELFSEGLAGLEVSKRRQRLDVWM